jgi:hypothetical protein
VKFVEAMEETQVSLARIGEVTLSCASVYMYVTLCVHMCMSMYNFGVNHPQWDDPFAL